MTAAYPTASTLPRDVLLLREAVLRVFGEGLVPMGIALASAEPGQEFPVLYGGHPSMVDWAVADAHVKQGNHILSSSAHWKECAR